MEPRNFETLSEERSFDEPVEPIAEEAAWHAGKKNADEDMTDDEAAEKAYLEELRGVTVHDDGALEE